MEERIRELIELLTIRKNKCKQQAIDAEKKENTNRCAIKEGEVIAFQICIDHLRNIYNDLQPPIEI